MTMKQSTLIAAFGEKHVARLTGLTLGQLRSWDRVGFFQPRYAYEHRSAPYSRVYSFQDVVGLRTIAVLMKDHGVSLQKLRKVAEELTKRGYRHWADVKLYVVKAQVHFRPPKSNEVEGVWDGQLAMVPIIDVISDVEARVQKLKKRDVAQVGHVERSKYVVRNSAVIAGTRIPTATIRRFKQAGYTAEQIIKQYPTLTLEDVHAALVHEEGLARSA
jgi:uncharacterized protein (DUF433 family)